MQILEPSCLESFVLHKPRCVFPAQSHEVLSHYLSLNKLSAPFPPPSGIPTMYVLTILMILHKSLQLSTLFFYSFFFLFLWLDNFKWLFSGFCASFFWSELSSDQRNNSDLNYSISSVIVFFSTRISLGIFLWVLHADILILYLYHFPNFI